MIDLEQARRLALARLAEYERQGGPAPALLDDRTRVLPYGWVFCYELRRYLEPVIHATCWPGTHHCW